VMTTSLAEVCALATEKPDKADKLAQASTERDGIFFMVQM